LEDVNKAGEEVAVNASYFSQCKVCEEFFDSKTKPKEGVDRNRRIPDSKIGLTS
jgi:hypothetical protein